MNTHCILRWHYSHIHTIQIHLEKMTLVRYDAPIHSVYILSDYKFKLPAAIECPTSLVVASTIIKASAPSTASPSSPATPGGWWVSNCRGSHHAKAWIVLQRRGVSLRLHANPLFPCSHFPVVFVIQSRLDSSHHICSAPWHQHASKENHLWSDLLNTAYTDACTSPVW